MKAFGLWSNVKRKLAYERRKTFSRKIHSQGSGLFGALGQGDSLKDSKHFEIVSRSEGDSRPVTAKQISAGWGHSAAVTEDGEVIVWGRPYDFSSLLRLKKLRDFSGGLARFVTKLSNKLGAEFDGIYSTPFLVNDIQKISSVHCSGGLTVALSASGDLYSFGQNRWGQCGAGDGGDLCFHSPQEVLINVRVKAVDTGLQHCIAVSECGRDVFAWGKAARGQLGNIVSDQVSFGIPQVVRGISGLVQGVSAGLNHSAALTAEGIVYLWGKGMSDQLDLENKNAKYVKIYKDQLAPRIVEIPGGRKALQICSSNYTLVIRCDDDSLWVLGTGEYDHIAHTSPIQVQQAAEDLLVTPSIETWVQRTSPYVVMPSGSVLKKGFTRVAIIAPHMKGLSTHADSSDDSGSQLFEIIINNSEAYLVDKQITIGANGGDIKGRTILDYCSGWTHNILMLDEKVTNA